MQNCARTRRGAERLSNPVGFPRWAVHFASLDLGKCRQDPIRCLAKNPTGPFSRFDDLLLPEGSFGNIACTEIGDQHHRMYCMYASHHAQCQREDPTALMEDSRRRGSRPSGPMAAKMPNFLAIFARHATALLPFVAAPSMVTHPLLIYLTLGGPAATGKERHETVSKTSDRSPF